MKVDEAEFELLDRIAFYRLIPVLYILALMLTATFGYLVERGLIRAAVEVPSFDRALTYTVSTIGSLMAISIGFKSLRYARIIGKRVISSPLTRTLKSILTLTVLGGGSAFLASLAGAITVRGAVRGEALVRGLIVLGVVTLYLCIWLFTTQILTLNSRGLNVYTPYIVWFLLSPYGVSIGLSHLGVLEYLEPIAILSPTYCLIMSIAPREILGASWFTVLSPESPINVCLERSTPYMFSLLVEFLVGLGAVITTSKYLVKRGGWSEAINPPTTPRS